MVGIFHPVSGEAALFAEPPGEKSLFPRAAKHLTNHTAALTGVIFVGDWKTSNCCTCC